MKKEKNPEICTKYYIGYYKCNVIEQKVIILQ